MTTRMFPKGTKTAKHTVNGRIYDSSAAPYLDVPDHDAQVLSANGWLRGVRGNVGTTAQRPTNPPPETAYLDTTVAAVVMWDGVNWLNVVTGAVA